MLINISLYDVHKELAGPLFRYMKYFPILRTIFFLQILLWTEGKLHISENTRSRIPGK